MAGRGNLHYAAFDVVWLKGKDLRGCPLLRRKRILSRLVRHTSTVPSSVFGVCGRGRDLLAAVERLDLEGIVAKRLADAYALSRVVRVESNRAAPHLCLAPDGLVFEAGQHPAFEPDFITFICTALS